jgi:hypothetical protein
MSLPTISKSRLALAGELVLLKNGRQHWASVFLFVKNMPISPRNGVKHKRVLIQ